MKVTIGIRDGTWFAILDTCSDLIWKQGYECTRLNVVFVFLFLFRFSLSVFMRCFKRTIGENSTFILIFKFCLINTVSLFPEGVLLHIKQLYQLPLPPSKCQPFLSDNPRNINQEKGMAKLLHCLQNFEFLDQRRNRITSSSAPGPFRQRTDGKALATRLI